jgi:hypothetical protein
MNKATEKAVDAVRKAAQGIRVPTGPDFEKALTELAGKSVNQTELKSEIDRIMSEKAKELSNKMFSSLRMTLGL